MVRKRILLVAMVTFPIASGYYVAQEIGSVGRGLALAQQACARCHAVQKQQTQSLNNGAPPFADIASVSGMTAIALSAALHTSHQTMPNLVLDPDEQADIVAYILSLK